MSRLRKITAAAMTAVVSVGLCFGPLDVSDAATGHKLSLSTSPNGTNPTVLAGARIIPSKTYYVVATSSTKLRMVKIWVDDSTTPDSGYDGRDAVAPYVMKLPANLRTGSHKLYAQFKKENGIDEYVTASFKVVAPPKPTTTTTKAPSVSTTVGTAPTTIPGAGSQTPVPAACTSFPVNKNTGCVGVPAGYPLKTSPGLTITKPGAVYDGYNFQGCVTVKANNVTIRNSRITCGSGSPALQVVSGYTGNLFDHLSIDGKGKSSMVVASNGYTLQWSDVSGGQDGIRANSNTVVRYNYVHGLVRVAGSHNDAVQTTTGQNVTIEKNLLSLYTNGDYMNACWMFADDGGRLDNAKFNGNFCDGGNFSVNGKQTRGGVSNVTITNNTFSRNQRYGTFAFHGVFSNFVLSGNKYEDGAAVGRSS